MANLGNAWHIPGKPEPRGRGAMRDPVGAIVPGTSITIYSGNQFRGPGGNPGNQLQTGSSLFFKREADANWTELPMKWYRTVDADKNKYYSATIRADISSTFQVGAVIQYYLRIAYDDHDTTFLHIKNDTSTTTAAESTARAAPFTFTLESSARWGQWGPVFKLPNVAAHAHLLPNCRVLMWGRRDNTNDSLDVQECTPFVWNPNDGKTTNTPQPELADGTKVNLFCSGHAFLPDGRLLVVGGHLADSDGVNQAALYDWATNRWTPTARMNRGRWYPTATSLPDGSVLVQDCRQRGRGGLVARSGADRDVRPGRLRHLAAQISHPMREAALAQGPREAGLDGPDQAGRPVGDDQQWIGQAAALEVLEERRAAGRIFLGAGGQVQQHLAAPLAAGRLQRHRPRDRAGHSAVAGPPAPRGAVPKARPPRDAPKLPAGPVHP